MRASWAPAAAYSVLIIILGLLLGPSLMGRDRLGFRDTSHFYTPLYEYVAKRQSKAWIPLWNPHDLTGLSLVGETTTAVFYPPRILLYRLIASPEPSMAWYAALHLLWAAIAIHVAARTAGATSLGCAVAIVSYPLAGPVLFNINNVPFLVGASWMPLALAGAVRIMRQADARWIGVTAIALAFPTLGGDPQTTVHALLIVISMLAVRIVKGCRSDGHRARTGMLGCVVAIGLSALVAAPQLAASIDWARQTSRLTDRPSFDRYDFSVPPWHWVELVVPEASGRLFPTYTRISQAIPGDGRMWVATLYCGLIPLIFSLHRYVKLKWRWDVWDALIPLGLLFAMAGPYWLLANLIPGYSSFRYPAKWLPMIPLGMSIMAARHTGQIIKPDIRTIKMTCVGIGCLALSLAMIAAIAGASERVSSALASLSLRDTYWGPLAISLAFEQVTWSALAGSLIVCLLWFSLRRARLIGFSLMALVALDMYVAARPQIATINRLDEASLIGPPGRVSKARAMRVSIGQPWPVNWSRKLSDSQRLLEVAASERGTNFGRWHLSHPSAVFNTATTLQPQRIRAFWEAIDAMDLRNHAEDDESWPRIESWLGIDHRWIVTTRAVELSGAQIATAHPVSKRFPSPLVRWDDAWKSIPAQAMVGGDLMAARLAEVARGSEASIPLVETESDAVPVTGAGAEASQIEVISRDPEKVQVRIVANRSGLLTIKSFQDGNWRAEIERIGTHGRTAQVVPVYPVDFLFMGAFIPSGDVKVSFIYQPWWLRPCVAFSAIGYLMVVSLVLRVGHRGTRPVPATSPAG